MIYNTRDKTPFSSDQINNIMFSRNVIRKSYYSYDLLDENDGFIDEIGVENCKVSNNVFRQYKRLANFKLNEYDQKEINFLKERIRPNFVLEIPSGDKIKYPLGIFLLSSPTQEIEGKRKTRDIEAFDKTIILNDDKLTESFYVQQGRLYTDVITQLFQENGIATFKITQSNLELASQREFFVGTSIKDIINQLLNEINYDSLTVDADGWFICEPYITPENRPIKHTYKADDSSVILPKLISSIDLLNRANVFVAYSVNTETKEILTSPKIVNGSLASRISTVARGREITKVINVENAPNMEMLIRKTERALIEESTAYTHFNYQTMVIPTHGNGDNVYIDIPNYSEIPLVFNETSWEIDTNSKTMQHNLRRLVNL